MAQLVQQPSAASSYTSPQHDFESATTNVHTDAVGSRVNAVTAVSSDQPSSSGTSHFVYACTKSSTTWVLDTGATDHIICDLALYDSYSSITNVSVQLPNGDKMFATHQGTIRLGSLLLQNVLHVPVFSLNLISISQLVRHRAISIVFHQTSCLIQEFPSLRMIGTAELQHGLYIQWKFLSSALAKPFLRNWVLLFNKRPPCCGTFKLNSRS
ncbi:hypothetical protein LINPERHAP1_LOCUS9993 [Linum perenne]